jgi:hypothetical protein
VKEFLAIFKKMSESRAILTHLPKTTPFDIQFSNIEFSVKQAGSQSEFFSLIFIYFCHIWLENINQGGYEPEISRAKEIAKVECEGHPLVNFL